MVGLFPEEMLGKIVTDEVVRYYSMYGLPGGSSDEMSCVSMFSKSEEIPSLGFSSFFSAGSAPSGLKPGGRNELPRSSKSSLSNICNIN